MLRLYTNDAFVQRHAGNAWTKIVQKGILSVYTCKFIVYENSRSIEFECLSPGPVLAHSGLTDIQDRFNPKNGTKTISIKFKTTFSSPLYERSRAKETLKNTKEKECTTEQGQSVKKKLIWAYYGILASLAKVSQGVVCTSKEDTDDRTTTMATTKIRS